MGKQKTKKNAVQAVRGGRGGVCFVVKGKRFELPSYADKSDVAEFLRGQGYARGAAVSLKGSKFRLDTDYMGDWTLVGA